MTDLVVTIASIAWWCGLATFMQMDNEPRQYKEVLKEFPHPG